MKKSLVILTNIIMLSTIISLSACNDSADGADNDGDSTVLVRDSNDLKINTNATVDSLNAMKKSNQ